MKIICNGKEREIREGVTIEGLILELELNPDTVVVECDGAIVLRGDYPARRLSEGSVLELIRFVGGG
ncbi:MAG: sulfur carrier protein ThiS [Desulfurivibrionaceae bacterium]|nr:sulfur carrier protein ThiS [Desulfurivibrionaceae bacterium]